MQIEDDEGSAAPSGQVLRGSAAIKYLLEKMMKKQHVQDAADLKMLRSYRWTMTQTEEATYEIWQREAVATERDRMQSAKKQALKDIERDCVVPSGKRTSLAMVVAPPLKDSRKYKSGASSSKMMPVPPMPDIEEIPLESANGLLGFFGAKAL